MLLNKISKATKLVKELDDLKYIQKKLLEYNDFNDFVKRRIELVNQYINTIKLLNAYDEVYFDVPDLSSFVKNIEQLIELLESEETLPTGHFNYVYKASEANLSHLKDLWKLYVDNKSAIAMGTLKAMAGLFEDKTVIQQTIDQLDFIKFKLPTQEVDLKKLDNRLEVAKELIKQLGADEEIENFLTLVLNAKATIEDLTPNILDWIKTKDFMNMLFIQFKK